MKATFARGAAVSLMTASAFGADLGLPILVPVAPPAFTWTGCYAGGQAGGGWGQKDLNDSAGIVSPISGFTSANLNISGYLLGGQIGCDYQFASIGWPALKARQQAGISAATVGVATPGLPGDSATFTRKDRSADQRHRARGLRMEQLASLRQRRRRVGERPDTAHSMRLATYDFEGLETRFGWTAGAGVEWAVCGVIGRSSSNTTITASAPAA